MNLHKSLRVLKKAMGRKCFTIVGLFIVVDIVGATSLTAQTVWLDQLDLSVATQGFGTPRKNKSVDGRTITIIGKTFERGFGTHAESSLLIQLDGKATLFTIQVGIDDEIKGHEPAVEFVVYGDYQKLWSSGLMRFGDAPKSCSVQLAGIKRLELVVTDGGNGPYYDHADWADAKFETTGVTNFSTISLVPSEPYILTPAPSPKPRINGVILDKISFLTSVIKR